MFPAGIKHWSLSEARYRTELLLLETERGEHIPWSFILSEDKASSNSTQAIASCNGSSKSGSLPLANNIIGLISIHRSPIANICASCEICPYIPNCDLGGKSKHAESDNSTDTVESYDQSSELITITHNRGDNDWNHGVEIGWG